MHHFDKEQFRQFAMVRMPKFVIDAQNRGAIEQLYYYFNSMSEFQGNLNKGIMLGGNIGSGKTTIIKLFKMCIDAYNIQPTFGIRSAREIARDFSISGYEGIEKYGLNCSSSGVPRPYDLVIDDLGLEQRVVSYGNSVDPCSEVLLDRYDLFIEKGIRTHVTTNLDPEKLKNSYPDRVVSRMKEMFNVIVLDGSDRRK